MRHLVLAAVLTAGCLSAQSGAVIGEYIEDRSNRVYGCPCEWSSEYVSSGREAVLAWNIRSGEFLGEKLDGLRLAAVITSDFNLSAAWATRRSTLFLDAAAPEARQHAGEAWLRSRYGDTIGRVVGVHSVPIDFRFGPESVSVAVPDVLRVEMRRARYDDDTQPWASLLYEPFTRLVTSTLGTTTQTRFNGEDLAVRWRRADTAITGYYGTFALR